MARSGERSRAAICLALVVGALTGLHSEAARAAYEGTPDASIFSDHFSALEEHEKLLNATPAAPVTPPPVSSIVERERRAALPLLPDIHETKGMTLTLLALRSDCPRCLPGPAAESTGLPVGLFEGAWRRAMEEGWRAGYDEMRTATARAKPLRVKSETARSAYYLRYIRRIVHGWQVAVVRTLRAENRITEAESLRYLAVLKRTLPPPGAAPHAPQRIRTGWVSDGEMAALDKRYTPRAEVKRLADEDAARIEARFRQPTQSAQKEKTAVEGKDDVIPFARLATGYAHNMLIGEGFSFLPEGARLWSKTGGDWTLEGEKRRVLISGGAAWTYDEKTKLGATMTWARSWRDGTNKNWQGESFFVSPFLSHALDEHLRLRLFGGLGQRNDRVTTPSYEVAYTGQSFHSGAGLEGGWHFGRLDFKPSGEVSLSRIALSSDLARNETRSRGRATCRAGFIYDAEEEGAFSKVEPFVNFVANWTFDRTEREMASTSPVPKNEFAGEFEGGLRLKAFEDFADAQLVTGIDGIGGAEETDYTLAARLKLSF